MKKRGVMALFFLLASAGLAVSATGVAASATETSESPIVFSMHDDPGSMLPGVLTVRPDGAGQALLVDDGRNPQFSPDGTRILYQGHRETGETERGDPIFTPDLWVMDADGRGKRRLATVSHDA